MIGKQLGSYRLLKLLGEGGMGRVFLAEHVGMNDHWAVKVLADEFANKPEIVARFLDEARAAARVRHYNLVRVVHVERTAEGVCFMALEYLDGISLGKYIATHGPASPDFVVQLACQIADALREIHAAGIIHRDIKPDNVMLVSRYAVTNVPILLDLGVAHLGKLATGPGTQAGTLIGTPYYMSPDQLLGEAVGETDDLFSLGVLAYELATGGHFPWQHEGESRPQYFTLSPTKLFHRLQTEGPVDPRQFVPGMSDAFAKALLAPLAFNVRNRPDDERNYILALAQAVPGDQLVSDGLKIVRDHAPRLLSFEDARSTIRVKAPAILSTPGSEAKYVLGEKLGAGGMAEVFAAQTLGVAGFERPVAIKRVLPELSAQDEFAAMFIAEARLASRLLHANIVAVSDFRKDDEGRLFLVMEYVDGKDLATVLECGSLPVALIIYIVSEALRGLSFAHSCVDQVTGSTGVIHRDVSPHNILVSRQGDVKIGDFGLSRAANHAGQALSKTIRGKTSYMAPEQVKNLPLDRRADLFAVGIVLWELLTGAQLFGGSQSESMAQVLFKDIPRPSTIAPGIPGDIDAITMQLLERDPDRRFQTADAAIAALRNCRDARLDSRDELARIVRARFPRPGENFHTPTIAASRGPAADRVTAPAPPSTLRSVASQSVPRVEAPRTTSGRMIVAGVAVLACATGGAFIAFRQIRHGQSAARSVDAGTASVAVSPPPPVTHAPVSIDAAIAVAPPAPPDANVATMSNDAGAVATAPVDAGVVASAHTSVPPPAHSHSSHRAPPPTPTTVPTPTANAATAEPGELAIVVKPWATIKLDGKSIGSTPYRESVPSGRHRLQLTNEDMSKDETLTITIEAGKTTKIEREWK